MDTSKRESIINDVTANLAAIREKTKALDARKLKQLIRDIGDPDVSVIPIVGRELLTIPPESLLYPLVDRTGAPFSGAPLFDHLLCQLLGRELQFAPDEIHAEMTLAEIAAAAGLLVNDRLLDRNLIFMKINNLMQRPEMAQLPIPTPLLHLTCIRDLPLFATFNWDTLLERAASEIWYGEPIGAEVRIFSPQIAGDVLPTEGVSGKSSQPLVFKLFGSVLDTVLNQAPPEPGFAATDGDMIEFLQNLLWERRPKFFFERLSVSHQLMLGIHFPGWMARLFLRITRNKPLWTQREKREYLADGQLATDGNLMSFIEQYCQDTNPYPGITAPEFVERLCAEWVAQNPERARAPFLVAPTKRVELEEDCVFISYASDDREKVVKIFEALRALGWNVWFDRKDLPSGDEYENRIERVISVAQACVVVLSPKSTGVDQPRFVYKEWAWAQERQLEFTTLSRPYIFPVRLTADTVIPAAFRKFNVRDALDGVPTQIFLDDMKDVLRKIRKSGDNP